MVNTSNILKYTLLLALASSASSQLTAADDDEILAPLPERIVDTWCRRFHSVVAAEIRFQGGEYSYTRSVSVPEFEGIVEAWERNGGSETGGLSLLSELVQSDKMGTSLPECTMWIDAGRIAVSGWASYQVKTDQLHIVRRLGQEKTDIFPIECYYPMLQLSDLCYIPSHIASELHVLSHQPESKIFLEYRPGKIPADILKAIGGQQSPTIPGWRYRIDPNTFMVERYRYRRPDGSVIEYLLQSEFVDFGDDVVLPRVSLKGSFGSDGFLTSLSAFFVTDAVVNTIIPADDNFCVPVEANETVVDHRSSPSDAFHVAEAFDDVLKAERPRVVACIRSPPKEVAQLNGLSSGRAYFLYLNIVAVLAFFAYRTWRRRGES